MRIVTLKFAFQKAWPSGRVGKKVHISKTQRKNEVFLRSLGATLPGVGGSERFLFKLFLLFPSAAPSPPMSCVLICYRVRSIWGRGREAVDWEEDGAARARSVFKDSICKTRRIVFKSSKKCPGGLTLFCSCSYGARVGIQGSSSSSELCPWNFRELSYSRECTLLLELGREGLTEIVSFGL